MAQVKRIKGAVRFRKLLKKKRDLASVNAELQAERARLLKLRDDALQALRSKPDGQEAFRLPQQALEEVSTYQWGQEGAGTSTGFSPDRFEALFNSILNWGGQQP